jgi:hypothetical protein
MSEYPNYLNSYSIKTPIWTSVFVFVFNEHVNGCIPIRFSIFSLSGSIFVFDKHVDYPQY